MRQPRIFTASFFAPDDHKPGTVFSIANSQPRGFGLPKLDFFRPGYLLGEYKSGAIDWPRYEWLYKYGLRCDYMLVETWVAELTGDITLCCWEADPETCHRKWAAEYLRSALGCEVMVR